MDSPEVLKVCNSVLPALDGPARRPWRRFCLVVAGSAEAASGSYETASEHLLAARSEMDRQPVIHDWYCRMMLEEALTELWLAKGALTHARPEAERFLELTLATAERTWQARAWETSASRVAMEEVALLQSRAAHLVGEHFAEQHPHHRPPRDREGDDVQVGRGQPRDAAA